MLRQCSIAFADMSAPTHDFKRGASFKSIIPLPQPISNTLALHSSPAARAGYPSITIPMGNVHGLPVGISFFGRAWSESVLIEIAFDFEQVSKARIIPNFKLNDEYL